MNELKIFENPEFGKVRMMVINNEPYFVGKDVAEMLGYTNTNKALSDHCKGVTKCYIPHPQGNSTLEVNIIPERDVYRLIMRSKLPSAEKFEEWVVGEVLPSIRKHGAYMTEQTVEKALTSPDFLIQLATNLKKEQEARMKAEATLAEQKPKVLFADTVSGSKTSILVGQLARLVKQKGLDIGQNRLFKWLRDKGYLMKNKNEPTQRSMDLKVMEVKERTVNNPDGSTRITRTPMITGKGQIYFVDRLLGGKRKAEKAD